MQTTDCQIHISDTGDVSQKFESLWVALIFRRNDTEKTKTGGKGFPHFPTIPPPGPGQAIRNVSQRLGVITASRGQCVLSPYRVSRKNASYTYFYVRVAFFKSDFHWVPSTESWTSWAQMKAENLKNPKIVLHVLSFKPLNVKGRFLGHPVESRCYSVLPHLDFPAVSIMSWLFTSS